MVTRPNLGHMLVAANLIDEVQMQIALAEQRSTGKRFGSTLVDLKFIDENVLAAFLSRQIDVPCISLLHVDIPRKIVRRLPAEVARDCQAVPIRVEDGKLALAMVDPTDDMMLTRLREAAGMELLPFIAPQSSIQKMIERFYSSDDLDDTLSGRLRAAAAAAKIDPDPHFVDLIEEIERGDFEQRLDRIENTLENIWTMLEKVLRRVEKLDPGTRTRS